jgi:phage anti-repressor protein
MNELIVFKERLESIAQSTEKFPVDFDEAWQWVEYSTKQKAREALERNFEAGIDYSSFNLTVKREIGATNKIQINLTADCFKSFCMMAGTAKGKEVRLYYIKIEKAWNTPELVAARARQMGVSFQPEPITWCPYPFFNQPNAGELLGKLIATCDKGYCSVEEFKRVVFSKPDTTPYKTPREAPNAAYAKTAAFLIGDSRKAHPDIAPFVEASLIITGSTADFVLVREVYERYSFQKENPISRPMFSRHFRLIYPEIGYKQKKVNGSAELIFWGVKFKEDDK